MNNLEQHIEVIIFTASEPVTAEFIGEMVSQIHGRDIGRDVVVGAVEKINQRYESIHSVFKIFNIAGGYQLLTKKEYDPVITHVQSNLSKKKLPLPH